MSLFMLHNKETAPKGSHDSLDAATEKFGFLPNILGVLAESPSALDGYISLNGLLGSSSFSPQEQQFLLLVISETNGCGYCVAAHTMGGKESGLPDLLIEAVRYGKAIENPRMDALRNFAVGVVTHRGWITDDDIRAFLNAGFTKAHILEVVLATAMKTISNYVNHMAETPLDEPFQPAAWTKSEAAA